MNKITLTLIFMSFLIPCVQAEAPLRIVGSSAVFPFAATVAEHFGYKTHAPIPLVEAIGTGAGIKLFCGSLDGPDGAITSRAMTEGEKKKCHDHGITYEEFKIGQDGLIFIQNKEDKSFSLTLKSLSKALVEKVEQDKECLKNPYQLWNNIQSSFPVYPIRVLGPAPTSGSYDVLVEKILGPCGPFLRHDGAYIEAPANENLIVQKVLNSSHTIGIVTFSFYDQNMKRLHALPLDGITPSLVSIQKGSYPLSRPLYLYIRTNDIQKFPLRKAYALEFTSAEAIGDKGYLNEKGLIPLMPHEQKEMHERAATLSSGKAL